MHVVVGEFVQKPPEEVFPFNDHGLDVPKRLFLYRLSFLTEERLLVE
jgi:hypothetical protein